MRLWLWESSIKISVVTVSYNSAATIGDTLRSVAAQRYSDVQHIVVDGASTDETMAVVDACRDGLAAVLSEPDRGVYDAMNKGIALADGEVVGFLNSDDVYADSGVLDDVAAAFMRPQVAACYGDLVYVDEHDTRRIVRYWKSRPYARGLCATGWMPAHPTFFVRRSVLERFGGFDLQYRLQADFELSLRLLEVHHIEALYIPRVMVRMRRGGMSNNSVVNVLNGNLEAYRACRNNGIAVSPLFVLRKIFSRLPQFFARPPVELTKGRT